MTLRISENQLNDLGIICEIPKDILESISEKLNKLAKPTFKKVEIDELFSTSVEDKFSRILTKNLVSLAVFQRREEITANQVFKSLVKGLKIAGWSDAQLTKWKDLETPFVSILNSDSLKVVSKTIDLSYDYANVSDEFRILTDIRPVFGGVDNQITGAIISQTLRISYVDSEGRKSLSLSLEHSDLERLASACKEAIRKAEVSAQLLQRECSVRTIMSGEENYGDD